MMQLVVSELSGGAGDRDFPWLQIESPAAPTEEAMRYNDAALAVSSGRTGKSEVVRPHPIITTTDEEPSRNAYNYYGVTNTRSLGRCAG